MCIAANDPTKNRSDRNATMTNGKRDITEIAPREAILGRIADTGTRQTSALRLLFLVKNIRRGPAVASPLYSFSP